MRKKRRHENPSSHHMRGKENPKVHLTDHGHSGKKKGTASAPGARTGVRPIKPAASKVRHPPLAPGMRNRNALNKIYI
jgi:hypothetical protein